MYHPRVPTGSTKPLKAKNFTSFQVLRQRLAEREGLCRQRKSCIFIKGLDRIPSPSYSAGLEFELTGVAQSVELA